MTWRIQFHKAVTQEDLPSLPDVAVQEILHAIRKKLTVDPQNYGEPLRKELFGFWKLRVGAYRAIYRFYKREVLVLIVKIGPRKDKKVYRDMIKRTRDLEL